MPPSKEEAEANAARIVALFNGCKEVPNIWFAVSSSSTPVKDLIDENGLLGEENQNLRKENERLKACAQIGEEWRENSSLEKWFPFTAEELKSLRKQLAEAKTQTKIAADLGDKCEQLEKILEDSRAELAKEKQRILFDQDAVDKLSRCGAEVEALIAELATLRQERRLWLRATNP